MSYTDSVVEDALEALGVEIVGASGDEIQCFCPVHHLTVGRAQSDPRFYMNAESGAALCFTCGWRGNLTRLVDDLEADLDLEDFEFTAMVQRADRLAPGQAEGTTPVEETVDPYVSEYAFTKHPYPPPDELCTRHLTMAEAVRLNLRWDHERRLWLIPIYEFYGELVGWQEKGHKHFINVPHGVRKSRSLFGFQAAVGKRVFVVESPLDAARFLRHGYAAVATYGAAMSVDQLKMLTRTFRDIVLAYDNDRAGWDATARVAEQVRSTYGRPVLYYRYPPDSYGEDPGSLSGLQFSLAAKRVLAVPPEIMRSLQEL
jgi:Toprim-like